MSSRLEKLEESLKREQTKADLRRLKKAVEYFDLGKATLADDFHNNNITLAADQIVSALNEELVYVKKVIEEA